MGEVREIYTIEEGKTSLRECVIPATNKHLFEVKSHGKILYEGESYQQAKSLYQELIEKRTKPADKALDVVPLRPKRRLVRLRTTYAEAS